MHTPSLTSFSLPSNELQDPYPEVELAPPPRAVPLSEPRLISHTSSSIEDEEQLYKVPSSLASPGVHSRPTIGNTSVRAKRESYDLSGSTFLITNNGRTLQLPVPSNSKADPLNWSSWKTAGAIFAVVLFSVVCLTAVQGVSVVMNGVQEEFRHEVCPTLLQKDGWPLANVAYTVIQNIAPWLIKALVTGPTLFMGLGCFLWVPLSIGLGRRPTILIATFVVLLAVLWAGEARSFGQLVGAVCFMGLGEGLALSLVRAFG
jgi:hypothetical protein